MGEQSERAGYTVVSDDGSGSLPRPEAVVQDGGGSLVHVSTWSVDGGLYTVSPAGPDTLYLSAAETGIRRVGGRVGWVGWMDAWMGQA